MKAKNVQSIICLVVFFLFANQVWAAEWIYYGSTSAGDVYYDKSSIKEVNKSIIPVWTKNILSEEAKTKYFSILKGMDKAPDNPSLLSYYIELLEIDCVNEKIKDTSVTIYDEKGNVIYSSPKNQSGEWNDIFPISVGEKLKNKVCEEPATPKEVVVASKVEEPVTPKEAVVAPKVEEPATPKEAVVAPKVEEPVTPNEAVVAAGPLFAAYSGHVASFKSEDNAVIFVKKMKAKGLVAFYQKEDVPGKRELYRAYIGRYETRPLARKDLIKLIKSGEIDYFRIQKIAEKNGEIVTKKMESVAQKNEPAQKPENKTAPSIDTQRYYEGIKGIVLKNGKVIKGQIISIDDNDVLKIRTKRGKFLSYSFMKEVKEYITE